MDAAHHIVVTGGAGRIGRELCKLLKENGFVPVVFDNLSAGDKAAVEGFAVVEGDVKSPLALMALLRHYKPVLVVHLAGKSAVENGNPLGVYHNNVTGTLALLAAMRETNVGKLVFLAENGAENGDAVGHSREMVKTIAADCAAAGQLVYAAAEATPNGCMDAVLTLLK